MARYCDGGACAKEASWRVRRDRQSSGGITTDAYCDGCRDRLVANADVSAKKFEQLLNIPDQKKA